MSYETDERSCKHHHHKCCHQGGFHEMPMHPYMPPMEPMPMPMPMPMHHPMMHHCMPPVECCIPRPVCPPNPCCKTECVKTFKSVYKMMKICCYRLVKVCPCCGHEFDFHHHQGMCPRCGGFGM